MAITTVSSTKELETSKLVKNTYSLLALTLIFSALTAGLSMAINPPFIISMGCSLAAIAIIWFVLPRTAQSSAGLVTVFAFTGLLGFGLGPMLNHYAGMPNGAQTISLALGGTGFIFLSLSAYVMTTKKNFDFLGGFLGIAMLVVFVAMIANMFMGIGGLSVMLSAAVIMIMSGFILYDTSRIINGGETNYIMATVSLYLNIYNIFTSLLHLLGMSDD